MKTYKTLTIVMVVGMICVLNCICSADTLVLLGPSEWIHLGDSSVASWPLSVGTSWTKTVMLDVSMVNEDAILMFDHIEADAQTDSVLFNGNLIGMLTDSDGVINRDPFNLDNWVSQTLTIQTEYLIAGSNILEFQCGISFPGTSFPYDDFMLKNMRMDVVPEPATICLFGLGSLVFLKRRKS
jgi:hypothetical protein